MSFVQDGTCSEENKARGNVGPIEGTETLARIVISPQHFNAKGEIKPGLFSRTDISKNGVSLTRIEKLEEVYFIRYATAVAELKDGQKLAGIVKTVASKLWSIPGIVGSGGKAFCLIEDPVFDLPNVPDNEAHAVAISTIPIDAEDEKIRLQVELAKIFSQIV
jgi:hypothetical protein